MKKQQITNPESGPIGPVSEQSQLIPLTLLAGELGEPIDTLVHRLGDELKRDEIGLRSCTVETARRLIAKRDEQAAEMKRRQAEAMHRLKELEAKRPKFRGAVAPIGAGLDSALAVLMSHDRELE